MTAANRREILAAFDPDERSPRESLRRCGLGLQLLDHRANRGQDQG